MAASGSRFASLRDPASAVMHVFVVSNGCGRHHRDEQCILRAGSVGLRVDNDLVFAIDGGYARVALDHAFPGRHLRTLSDKPLIQEGNTASGKQSSPTGWHREMRSTWCAAGVGYRDKALPADAERRRSEHYWGRTPTPFAFLRLTSPHRNQIAGEPRAGRMAIVASSPRPRREQTTTSSDRRPGGVVGVHTRQRSDYAAGHGLAPMTVSR